MQANLQQINVTQSSLSQAVAANRPIGPATSASDISTAALSKAENAVLQSRPSVSIDTAKTGPALSKPFSSDDLALMQVKQDAKVEYDKSTRNHQGAISSYLTTQHSAKREEIQQMVGIDLYA
jgi:hypothetical protein